MSKKFLIPVAAAVAALSSGNPAEATQSSEAKVDTAKQQPTGPALGTDAQQMLYPQGDALHSLLLTRTEQGTVLAQHDSHFSHSSHSSHSSHYSGQ
jgi:hypothetical protein